MSDCKPVQRDERNVRFVAEDYRAGSQSFPAKPRPQFNGKRRA